MRKIIQLSVGQPVRATGDYSCLHTLPCFVYALCDDNSIWFYQPGSGSWYRLNNVPQEDFEWFKPERCFNTSAGKDE